MAYGSALPSLTGTLSGVAPGDGITATYSTIATAPSSVGKYPITPVPADPNHKLGNYTLTTFAGQLTVTVASATMTVKPASSSIQMTQPLSVTVSVSGLSGKAAIPTGDV
jgi:hypothetical protein